MHGSRTIVVGKIAINLYDITETEGVITFKAIKNNNLSTIKDVSTLATDKVQKSEETWYTISGQRVTQPTKVGLYFHHGHKVVIK